RRRALILMSSAPSIVARRSCGPGHRRRVTCGRGVSVDRRECDIGRFSVALLLTALAVAGCRARADQPPKPAKGTVAWHQLGSWSGRGNLQTESFTSDTGT